MPTWPAGPGADVLGAIREASKNASAETARMLTDGQQPQTIDPQYLRIKLDSIEGILDSIAKDGPASVSSVNAKDAFRSSPQYREPSGRGKRGYNIPDSGNLIDDFFDGIEEGFKEGWLGYDYRDRIDDILKGFADEFGVEVRQIPGLMGKELGKQALSAVKGSPLGAQIMKVLDNVKDKALGGLQDMFNRGVADYNNANGTSFDFSSILNGSAQQAADAARAAQSGVDAAVQAAANGSAAAASATGDAAAAAAQAAAAGADVTTTALATTGSLSSVAAGASSAGAAAAGLSSILVTLGPVVLVVAAAFIALGPLIEGAGKALKALGDAAGRTQASRKTNLQLAQARFEADVEAMIKKPFEILEDAANNVYQAWDQNVRMINGVQGYTKEGLQDLLGAFAERLRSEGLSSVISATDITDNLAKVLDAGLTGPAAEEFAYLATKLNAAIPNQDFFGYADTYASIAANAMKAGASQSEAIAQANTQLEAFANNVLYAGRQLSGGFSTGLKDAQSLFDQAVKITQTARTGDANNISGVLTSVAAITSSIAPDLASSVVEAVTKAATGGNSSDIVALRSLAGINASNTEFLKAFANDPQKVFKDVFTNLSKMQNMADGAYMEVAEGLSEIFGLSMDAFARVDFAYLAQAIDSMNVNSGALEANMKQLASGQTTTSAEMMKMRQINEYLIDNGLAYVMDNEVARAVQQHMWEEQMMRELKESEYAVNLKGAALEFLESIVSTVENILNFLNPLGWLIKSVTNIASTVDQYKGMEKDIKTLLEAGVVGKGNSNQLAQLTTRNVDLNLTPSLLQLWGKESQYQNSVDWLHKYQAATGFDPWLSGMGNAVGNAFSTALDPTFGLLSSTIGAWSQMNSNANNQAQGAFSNGQGGGRNTKVGFGSSSEYQWGMIGKSLANALGSAHVSGTTQNAQYAQYLQAATSSTANVQQDLINKVNELISEQKLGQFAQEGKRYDQFVSQAVKSAGISDWKGALEVAGYTEEQIKNLYRQYQVNAGNQLQQDRQDRETGFWETLENNTDAMKKLLEEANKKTDQIIQLLTESNAIQRGTQNILVTQTNQLIAANTAKVAEVLAKTSQFYMAWVDYFVLHTAYNKAYNYTDVQRIQTAYQKKEKGDAVYALAEALTANTVDLRDPQVQTNALLSQILIVLQAIMQQNNNVGGNAGTSLIESLSALSMGITVKNG